MSVSIYIFYEHVYCCVYVRSSGGSPLLARADLRRTGDGSEFISWFPLYSCSMPGSCIERGGKVLFGGSASVDGYGGCTFSHGTLASNPFDKVLFGGSMRVDGCGGGIFSRGTFTSNTFGIALVSWDISSVFGASKSDRLGLMVLLLLNLCVGRTVDYVD